MQTLSPTEVRDFLLARTRTGKLATVRADARPHVVPIWFELDGDTVVFTTWHATVKATNMRRDPHVSMCVDQEVPPFAFVLIEGTAELIDDAGALRHWATRIAARYMGAGLKPTASATVSPVSCSCVSRQQRLPHKQISLANLVQPPLCVGAR
jgi:PPOX class probable F420-dependent enzyme